MHRWGDGFPYFADVENAAYDIEMFCRRWGRFGGQSKEKFGTVRFYARFYGGGIYSLVKPGYYFYHWPKWAVAIELFLFSHTPKCLKNLIYRYQAQVYRKAYSLALKKYPHIREEILGGADYEELLEGL